MLLKSVITKYPQLLARNISYVQRARLLEKIKNDDDFCKESMVNGKFLLYNKASFYIATRQVFSFQQGKFLYCNKACFYIAKRFSLSLRMFNVITYRF